MNFSKYQGLGNDFIIVNGFEEEIKNPALAAVQLCDRRLGIGADGLVLLLPSVNADFKMQIINSDGTEAEMCGNASRCVPLYLHRKGLSAASQITLNTPAGRIITRVIDEKRGIVSVDMGAPRLLRGQIPVTGDANSTAVDVPLEVETGTWRGTAVSMGNPHFVIFVPEIEQVNVAEAGPQIETHSFFPRKTNVEFVQVLDSTTLRMRVWERGAGITKACGTGACAAVVAATVLGYTQGEVTVKLDGGDLTVAWPEQKNIFMTGAAEAVYDGQFLQDILGN